MTEAEDHKVDSPDAKLSGAGSDGTGNTFKPPVGGIEGTAADGSQSSNGVGNTIDKALREADAPAVGWEAVPLYIQINSEFRKMLDGEAKTNFAHAIRRSFALDTSGRASPCPSNPRDIENEYGFSISAQKKYRMSFGKDVAFKELLEPINAPVNQGLYKKLNKDSYPIRFSRAPFILYEKQMILTVAEWLHFVPYEFQCPLPAAIDEYLGP